MRAVLTVIGKDTVGILAKVSAKCAEASVNIIEVTQSVLQNIFCMIMICDIDNMSVSFDAFADNLSAFGEEENLKVHVMHEDIFNSMHRI
jgi:ACT domain-containing protein